LREFGIERIKLNDLIATALDDPQAVGDNKMFRGINFVELHTAYRRFCRNEAVSAPAVGLGDVIDFYNKAAADLPDPGKIKGLKLPGVSVLVDGAGQPFAEVFEENQRRAWVPLREIFAPDVEKLGAGPGHVLSERAINDVLRQTRVHLLGQTQSDRRPFGPRSVTL
jgi:hypothetical protein